MDQLRSFLMRQIWPPLSARRIGERLTDYVRERAAGLVGLEGEPVELEPAESGKITVIRRWRTVEAGTLYLRAWPADPRTNEASEHATVSGLLGEAGLEVPRVLMVDDTFETLRKWRIETVVETEAPGAAFDLRTPGHQKALPEIARRLAHLHGVTSALWGKPWRTVNEMADPRKFWAGRIKKFRERITPATSGLDQNQLDQGLDQLATRLGRIELQWPVLIHGDLNGSHLFIDPEGRITWIDFGTVQYGLPERDLAEARSRLSGAERFASFLRAYEEAAGGDRTIDLEAIKTFTILGLWEKLNSRVQRIHHRRERGASAASLKRLETEQHRIEKTLAGLILASASGAKIHTPGGLAS